MLKKLDSNAEFQIVADGDSPLQPVTASIRVSSSVADIHDSIRTIIINPATYRAIITPEIIGGGDTATIVVQRYNENGLYEDCQENQQYEIAMMDGCVYGDILAKTGTDEYSKSNYFASAAKPLMFVAADSVEGDGGTVKLKIGIVESSFGKTVKANKVNEKFESIRADLEKFYAKRRVHLQTVHKKEQEDRCYCGFWNSQFNTNAKIDVINKCGDYDKYDPNNYVLDYEIVSHSTPYMWKEDLTDISPYYYSVCNYNINMDSLATGESVPLPYTWLQQTTNETYYESWDIKPLYEFLTPTRDEKLHFLIVSPQDPNLITNPNGSNVPVKLIFDVIADICTDNIDIITHHRFNYNPVILTSLDDLKNIPKGEIGMAREDFMRHKPYPTTNRKYYIKEVIMAHENEHINDFKTIVNKNFSELKKKIAKYSELCTSFNDVVKKNAKNIIRSFIFDFIQEQKDIWNNLSGETKESRLNNEQGVQSRASIQNLIETYIQESYKY